MAAVTHASAGYVAAEKPALSMDRVDSVMSNDSTTTTSITSSTKPVTGVVSTSGDGVRILALHEWREAAASLAEAFWEDHSSRYFIDTPELADWTEQEKWELHLKIMEFITYAHLLKGLVVSAGPNYDCVALWMPPGNNMDDYLTIFRSGMWRLNYLLCREGRHRFFTEFLPLLGDTKAAVLGGRDLTSWYLVYIGTKPSGRGKGYARRVIEHVTRQADGEGRACYLESSNAVNRKIYGRMGFEMRRNIYLQRGEDVVVLDIMVREPVGERARKGEVSVLGKAE